MLLDFDAHKGETGFLMLERAQHHRVARLQLSTDFFVDFYFNPKVGTDLEVPVLLT
jgi:hypothetical protein